MSSPSLPPYNEKKAWPFLANPYLLILHHTPSTDKHNKEHAATRRLEDCSIGRTQAWHVYNVPGEF